MSPRVGGLLLAICLCVGAARAGAQESVNTASIGGRVIDPQGAVVPGVSVVARETTTNIATETVTDADGRFRFPYLRVGHYEIKAHLQGFADAVRGLTVTLGSAFELPLQLSSVSLDATVTVMAEAPVLEAARSQIAGTISQAEVRSLPLNGRNFLDLALLVPGVSPTNTASTQLFAETSAVPGQGLSVGSQRNMSNNFIVDGLSANDDAAGLSGMPYGVDAVDQFQVVTSGGQAELGRALGGYFSVVTRSGSNELHGDGYGYFRDDALNAANALNHQVLPMDQQQFGASAGGPLQRNRTFYFGNVERRILDQSGLVTIDPTNLALINAKLTSVGYAGLPVTTGVYSNPVRSTNALGKIDHQVSSRDQFSLRYSLYQASSLNSRGAGGLSAPSASAGLDDIDQTLAFSNTLTLSPRTVNETRAQFAYSDLKAAPTDPVGPAVSIAGVASFGTLSASPTARQNSMFEIVDNLSHQAGAHALRAGVDVLYNDDTITFPRSNRGSYAFSSLANFLLGAYNNAGFSQTFGATVVSQTNPNVGIYVQDEWTLTSQLTLNAGLRYDLQFLQTIRTDTNNAAPRAGFAWTPFASRRTVIRGGGGIFYDRVPLRALANALLSAGNTTDLDNLRQNVVSLSPAQAGAPAFPNVLPAAVQSVTLPNVTTMDPDMRNAYSRQANVEIEQQIGQRGTVSIGYQYTRGVDLIIAINQNVPSCVASGTNNGCRPVSTYGNDSQYSPAASSVYQGLHLSWVQHPASWGQYRVSYTFSKAMDNVSEFFFSSPIDPFDLSKDWGRSDDDQRHRFVVDGSLSTSTVPARNAWQLLTHGLQLSGMLQAYSSLPFNITSGVTTVQGTAGRPLVDGAFIPRNAGAGPDFFSLNLRLSRAFQVSSRLRLEGLIEAFNVTNRVNVVTVNGNFGTGAYPSNPLPSFGQPTAVGDPRAFQLGVRMRW
jgi:Carboxypeptidase regulatory-like domain/TonB dependent receptor